MKLDAYSEIYLWNKNVDALIRVLQPMEALGILPGMQQKRTNSGWRRFARH